ncbi:hypothetical protein CFOL_v3_28958 [Cephalotus follicularis]|uniref:Exo_endo_phos domain-containing protein n=1 Tax=Cephalotus follicularis TaxID=3775 RepID=A0A1Q3CZA2_CEPFO|nr:hypothetical protein CFOL_v3_28958 [Cephalotus follicularis]
MFLGIYTNPSSIIRKDLWSNFQMFSTSHNLPWLVLRDFNEVMAGNEKLGVAPVSEHRLNNFCNCINFFNLIDVGYVGPKFTWTKLQSDNLIMERLDRAFSNNLLKILFPNILVTHLSRLSSDHALLLWAHYPLTIFPIKNLGLSLCGWGMQIFLMWFLKLGTCVLVPPFKP